ncbi:MAG: PLP-dependent aminotransferase family protein [Eubacteriales bacterium]
MDYVFSDKIAELKPSAIREIFKNLTDPSVISFAAGNPAAESFPVSELAALSADIFENMPVAALQYSITEGYEPLRSAVSRRQKEKFGIVRDFDSTIIVSGGQQGIELSCKVFCNEGDVVICEDPSFIGALNAFRSCGAKPVGVPMESDGISTEGLAAALDANPRAKLIYLIPTFQNPSGITMSARKRKEVYEIARSHGVMILEDNPYGELRFAGDELPTIKSMDTDGIVIYCSSFSKILSAGMRVGFVIAPAEVSAKMVVAKQSEDVHTNIFFQMLCHRYFTEYDVDAHISKIRGIYRRKCSLMLDCLERYMPDGISFTRPEGGLFIWGTIDGASDSSGFVRKALEKKVAVVPGQTFCADTSCTSPSFRLNYSTPSDEQIELGTKLLGEAAREFFAE